MTQTDAEIVALVARSLLSVDFDVDYYDHPSRADDMPTRLRGADSISPTAEDYATAVVAALAEAGRLVPEGCVAIDAGRWERVRRFADVVLDGALCSSDGDVFLTGESHDAMLALMSGDLDTEPTP